MSTLAEVLCPGFAFHTGCNHPKLPGDCVFIGNNRGPLYVIVHVSGTTAWVRPMEGGAQALVQLDRLRLANGTGAAWPVI